VLRRGDGMCRAIGRSDSPVRGRNHQVETHTHSNCALNKRGSRTSSSSSSGHTDATSDRQVASMLSARFSGSAYEHHEDGNGYCKYAASSVTSRTQPHSKSRKRTPVLVTRLLSGQMSDGLNAWWRPACNSSAASVNRSSTARRVGTLQRCPDSL